MGRGTQRRRACACPRRAPDADGRAAVRAARARLPVAGAGRRQGLLPGRRPLQAAAVAAATARPTSRASKTICWPTCRSAMRPWRELVRRAAARGTLPAWNPHVADRRPVLLATRRPASSRRSACRCGSCRSSTAFGVVAALKLWAAAFGTYLLVRELRLGFLPGLLAGRRLRLLLDEHHVADAGNVPAVVVMLPWMLWLVERLFRGGGLGSAIGLACVTAVALGGGHPGHAGARARRGGRVRAAARRARAANVRAPRARCATLGLALGGMVARRRADGGAC